MAKTVNKVSPPAKVLKEKPKGPRPVPPGKTPWADKVAASLAKREAQRAAAIANGADPAVLDDRTGLCAAFTTGNYGPKRPCANKAMVGFKTCGAHTPKTVKERVRLRLMEEAEPSVDALVALRDGSGHDPTRLGAAKEILNRVMGKPDSVDKEKGAGRATIVVGVAIGAIPRKQMEAAVTIEHKALPAGDAVIEGEVDETE